MIRGDLLEIVIQEVKGLSTHFEEEDWENAIDDALSESGWAFPVTNTTKISWLKKRTKRHLFFMLMSESAHKFKFKQYNLQHRFLHYSRLIKEMDSDWEIFVNSEMLYIDGAPGAFSSKIDAGFQSDELGRDTTYSDENKIIIAPNETD